MRRSSSFALVFFALLMLFSTASPVFAQDAPISIAEARSQGTDATVTVEGIVTRAFGAYVRLQDDSGPTGASALVIRQVDGGESSAFQSDIADGTIAPGTTLQVSGTLSEFNGLLQINGADLTSYTVVGQTTVPAPQEVTLATLESNGEDYESELVRIPGLELQESVTTFAADNTYRVASVENGTTFDFRVQGEDESALGGTPAPPGLFTYTGVVGQFSDSGTDGYQLIPIRTTDLETGTFFSLTPQYRIVQEDGGTVSVTVRALNVSDGETVTATVEGVGGTADATQDVGGLPSASVSFTGPEPAPKEVTLTITNDDVEEGVEHLSLSATSPDGSAAPSATLWILDDPTAQGPLATGLEGTSLLDELETTYGTPTTLGYGAARDTMYRTIYNDDGIVEGFYSGLQATVDPNGGDASVQAGDGGINTEHVWPRSKGAEEEPALSNMHILVPARGEVNTARSNFPFGEIDDADTDRWFFEDEERSTPPTTNIDAWSELDDDNADRDNNRFEPREAVKGDVARALFYFATVYPNRADRTFLQTQKETLLQWHADDPVDATEMRRNVLQATYQDNKLNPFVVDPTLAERAFGIVIPPTQVNASDTETSVRITWSQPFAGVAAGYNVYRSASMFDAPGDAQKLNETPISETEFTDPNIQIGGRYVYRITAVDAEGTESALSEATEVVVYPSLLDLDITRTFDDPGATSSYQLVALPGNVDTPIDDELGDPNTWTAYWDNGSEADFLVSFDSSDDGSDQFNFQPGRGFWLLSTSDWTVNTTVASAALSPNQTVSIPLHDGWNIISNPLPVGVAWADVEAANGGTLQALWQWDAGFQQATTFGSASTGEAFYFFNDQALDELVIPLTPPPSAPASAATASRQNVVTLTARLAKDGSAPRPSARVQVAEQQGARNGRDAYDQVAPPGRFAPVSLHVKPSAETSGRSSVLAEDVRAPSRDGGHRYTLDVHTQDEQPVVFTVDDLPARSATHAVLVNPATGQRYDLREQSSITPTVSPDGTTLTLLVGTQAFVQGAVEQTDPSTLSLSAPAPNPFREQTTLEYTLPTPQHVRVTVYDVLGRRVGTLVDQEQPAGTHRISWGGASAQGRSSSSGMYLIRWEAAGQQRVHKVVQVR